MVEIQGLCYQSNSVKHKFTLRYASHTIPILSLILFIPSLYSLFFSFASLPSFFMQACMYEASVFVVVYYKH